MLVKNVSDFSRIFLSLDTAIKIGTKNDPTVCSVWGEDKNNLFLLEVYREWLEYPELKKRTISWINTWNPNCVLIEDKASGQSLLQEIKKETRVSIIGIRPTKDKITRLASVSAMFEAGKIFLPIEANWLADYENELLSFPFCEHDDQVDSTSQFLEWYKNNEHFMNRELRIRKF
jgi:predicted phage terminase large subunit-like protein